MSIEILEILNTDEKQTVFFEALEIALTHFKGRAKRAKEYSNNGKDGKQYIGKDGKNNIQRNAEKLEVFAKLKEQFWNEIG